MLRLLNLLVFSLLILISSRQSSNCQFMTHSNDNFFYKEKIIDIYTVHHNDKIQQYPSRKRIQSSKKKINNNSGFTKITEFGFQFKNGYEPLSRLKLNMIYGYNINKHFSFGVGTGLRYYYNEKTFVIPIFTDFRTTLSHSKVSPYISLGLGYSFKPDFYYKLGPIIYPCLGVNFKVKNSSTFKIGLGYELQKATYRDLTIIYVGDYKYLGSFSVFSGVSF